MTNTWFECRITAPQAVEALIYDRIGEFGLNAKSFISELKKFGTVSQLTVGINSAGGDVFEGLGIYNYLKSMDSHVTTRVDGIAGSIASVIAMAGDDIVIPENACIMVHDPSGIAMGNAKEMTKTADTLGGVKKSLVGIYAKRTGLPVNEIEAMMEDGTWMWGQEAVDRGFATRLVDAIEIKNNVDLSGITNVPEQAARVFSGTAATWRNKMSDSTENTTPAVEQQPVAPPKTNRSDMVAQLAATADSRKPALPKAETPTLEEFRQIAQQTAAEQELKVQQRVEERARKIRAAYSSATMLGFSSQQVDDLINNGLDVGDIPETLIQAHAMRTQQSSAVSSLVPTNGNAGITGQRGGFTSSSGVRIGFSNEDPAIEGPLMVEAIAAQVMGGTPKEEAARKYMGWRPQDFMRETLAWRNVDCRGMTRSQIVDEALRFEGRFGRSFSNDAMHSTSDFPNLLGAAANKVFLGSYNAAPVTYRQIAVQRNLSNFQSFNLLRDGDFPSLAKVLETGEFTSGTMSESKETAQLSTYGRIFSISRQSLVNDTLGVFGQMTAKIGQAVARFENSTVWGVINTNPVMGDGGAFYNATAVATPGGHANWKASTGNAISATSLSTGRKAMRLQKSLDGNTLNIVPVTLAVSAAKETLAEQVLNPLSLTTTAADVATVSLRRLNLLVEPLIDSFTNAISWYLFSDPQQGAAIQYGYLEGDSAPRITTNEPFDQDGISFKVRLDFHAEPVDWRFTYGDIGA